jgi:hypothetical protein
MFLGCHYSARLLQQRLRLVQDSQLDPLAYFFILFSKTNAWLCITRGAVAQLLVYELTHMEYHALLKTSLMSFNCNLRPFCPIDIYFVIMKR